MDVIWNLTRVCPCNCRICCVSAYHVSKRTERFVYFSQKEDRKQLNLSEKLEILKMLANRNFEIDFSGGDPLYYDEDFHVVEYATRLLPARKIGVSMTGCRLTDEKMDLLKRVGVVEFTLDNLSDIENPFRPREFNVISMMALRKCVSSGIKTRAITVLYSATISEKNLRSVYEWLCKNNIPEWELLRFYPVGRSMNLTEIIPLEQQYLTIMKYLRGLVGSTKILFQHSLKILEGGTSCPAVRSSFGILPDGKVVACPWAIDENCSPLNGFYLGKLPEEDLDEIILKAQNSKEFSGKFNNCRIICRLTKR